MYRQLSHSCRGDSWQPVHQQGRRLVSSRRLTNCGTAHACAEHSFIRYSTMHASQWMVPHNIVSNKNATAAISNVQQQRNCRCDNAPLRAGPTSPGVCCNPADLQSSQVTRSLAKPATIPVKAAFQSSATSVAAKSVRTSSYLSSLFGPPTKAP